MNRLLIGVCLGLCVAPVAAFGHDSPEHVIEDLSIAMQRRGRSPELLYRRATEYRVLGRLDRAAEDLQAALELSPDYLVAQLELGRVHLALGDPDKARIAVERAEPLAKEPHERALVHMTRCELHLTTGKPEEALRECQQACRLHPGEVEWLLQRSQLQADLGRHGARIRDLQAARKQNPSVVLQIELIEAWIDAGQFEEALPQIESELADSRWRSSWLLRRARILQRTGKDVAAASDLRAAIEEIDARLHPARPDAGLLVDRGTARAMLGDLDAARADLDAARARGADAWTRRPLERLLAGITATSSSTSR